MTPLSEWERCKPWIEAALERTGFYSIEDVERQINESQMTFWPGQHGAVITEFIIFPNGKALNVFAGGGESNESLREFVEVFEPSVSAWAKINDCKWVMGYGRPGWERPLLPLGYKRIWSVMAKEIV